jgi:pyruvate-formate lyase
MSWQTFYHHYTDELGMDYDTDLDTEVPYYGPEIDPADQLIQKAVRMVFERMDKLIQTRIGSTVRRRTFGKGDRRPVNCEIDTFVVR